MINTAVPPLPEHVVALRARVCLPGVSTLVTDMHSYGHAVALVVTVLHSLPATMRTLLILPSVHHYRTLWQPYHSLLFPAEPLVVRAHRAARYVQHAVTVHCGNIPGAHFDLVVTLTPRAAANARHTLCIGTPPDSPRAWCLDVRQPTASQPRWLLAESPFPRPCDDLTAYQARAQQVCDDLMGGTKRAAITGLAHALVQSLFQGSRARRGFVPGHCVLAVSSDRATMHALALPLVTAGVATLVVDDEYVTPGLARRMVQDANVVVVHHAFQELAALATLATRVYVLDTLVRPGVMQQLWVLSHYVPVVTLRVDLRYADSRRATVEHPDTITLFRELHDGVPHCPLEFAEPPVETTESAEHRLEYDLDAGATAGAIAGETTQELPRAEPAEPDFELAEGAGDVETEPLAEGAGDLGCPEELAPWGYLVEVAGRRACLSQLGVADLWRAAQDGATTFTLIRGDAVAPYGWLHATALAAVAARLPVPAQQPAPTSVRQGVEADALWYILSAGKPDALTAVDWAAAATLLLCRVLLGPHPWCTLHFGVTDATGLFEYHHGTWARCCAQITHGQLWGVMLDYTDGNARHCVPVYLFTNSAAAAAL